MKKIKKLGKSLKRDRKPGEILTRAAAMRSLCLSCCGNSSLQVQECQNMECHLYPYRLGMRGIIDPEVYKEKEKYGEFFPNSLKK